MTQATRTSDSTDLKHAQDAIVACRFVVADAFGGRRKIDDAKLELLAMQAEARHIRHDMVRRRREQCSRMTELLH